MIDDPTAVDTETNHPPHAPEITLADVMGRIDAPMPDLTVDLRWLADLHKLLSALRAAGWRHTRVWRDGGRDTDGAPLDNGWIDHYWHRDVPGEDQREQIYLCHEWDAVPPPISAVTYRRAEDDDWRGEVMVGGDVIEAHGLAWLAALARHVGVLPTSTEETTDA